MEPGLLESVYETCLAFELRQLGFKVEQQMPLPVVYKEVKLDCGYRLNLVVELEIKAVQGLVHSRRAAAFISADLR